MKYDNIPWKEDAEYSKDYTQMRLGMPEAFRPLQVDDKIPIRYVHGLNAEVQEIIEDVCRR